VYPRPDVVAGSLVEAATFFARFEKLPWWQIMLGAVVAWIAVGALAWWSFHR
jgi:hypothetical protein